MSRKYQTVIIFFVLTFCFFLNATSLLAQRLDNSFTSLTSPYKKMVRQNTGVGKVYDITDITTSYKWYATLHTPQFIEAVQAYAKELYPNGPSPQAEKYLQQMITPGQTSFFISLYARQRGLKRMGEADSDLWQSTLKVGAQTFKPIAVERVPLTPFQYRFYPYVDKWYFAYRMVFPYDLSENPNLPLALQLASVGGVSEVEFNRDQ